MSKSCIDKPHNRQHIWEFHTLAVANGLFRYRKCSKCSQKRFFDFEYNGAKFSHPGWHE